MRTDELFEAVRLNAFIKSNHPNYGNAVLLNELNAKNQKAFAKPITSARCGYWLQQQIVELTPNRKKYPIPARSVMGGLEKIEIIYANQWIPLTEVFENHAGYYETVDGATVTGSTDPFYVLRGSQIELLPTPAATGTMRVTYYRRGSTLVTQQSSTANGGVIRGRVLHCNTTSRVITVNALPLRDGTGAALVSNDVIDVIRPSGWFELGLCDAPVTVVGDTLTIGGTDPLDEIQVGDYVRFAQQTDWPQLPEEFHTTLADLASIKICIQLGYNDKARELAAEMQGDMARFLAMLAPRTKRQPKRVPVRLTTRGTVRRWGTR